jgi:hypothetical protein
MKKRVEKEISWFVGQCPNLYSWIYKSELNNYIESIRIFSHRDMDVVVSIEASGYEFLLLTSPESVLRSTITAYFKSERYGDRVIYNGFSNISTWNKIEDEILSLLGKKTSPFTKDQQINDIKQIWKRG